MNSSGMSMRLMSLVVLAAAAFALVAAPAEAARTKRSKSVAAQSQQAVRGEAGVVGRRSRTRITVTRRSYLDAGTEVYPGSMHYTDYAFPPNARGPLDFYLPIEAAQSSLPHPWWLRSYHAPLGILIALVRSRVT
jgi:hypothetical protein